MKSFPIIGLGRFGFSLATELCAQGNEVLGLHLLEDRVQAAADQIRRTVAVDAQDPGVLHALGARNFDCAVVAACADVGDNALTNKDIERMEKL